MAKMLPFAFPPAVYPMVCEKKLPSITPYRLAGRGTTYPLADHVLCGVRYSPVDMDLLADLANGLRIALDEAVKSETKL
jgi:hypothetical protein